MQDAGNAKDQFPEPAEMLPCNVKMRKSEDNYRQAAEELPAVENVYQTLFENTGNAIFTIEEDNTILLANGEFEKLTGYARKEVEGKKKWTELVARKDDLERMKEYHRLRLIDPLSAPHTYEFQLVDREGQIKDIVVTVTPIPGSKQTLAALLDISDRKRMEAALKESERRLADIIDFLPDATLAIDRAGKVIAWNQAIEEMTGVKAGYILGKGEYEYALPFYGMRRPILIDLALGSDEEIEKKYDFVSRKGNVLLAEVYATLKGVPRTLWGKARPLYDINGNVAGAIESIRDISELKQAQEDLQKAHDELEIKVRERTAALENANKELESFAYSVSHDLRAPLRAIDGFSRILFNKIAEKLDDEEKRRFEVIRDNARKMGRLIDDILAFSRLGRQALAFSVINMSKLVNQIWEELLVANPDRRISLQINTLPTAFGDTALIRQVLVNLLSNAVKFTRRQETPLIEISGEIEDAEIVYFVRDNGAGFDMNYAGKLFGVFQRLHSQEEYEGTGAGLAIVQRIISRHNGRVWAEGAVDQGATFYFTLPKAWETGYFPKLVLSERA